MDKQSSFGQCATWLGCAYVVAAIVLGVSLYETNRKTASNVGRIDAELKTAQGRIASLETIRELVAAQSADLESKYQALVARVDAAAVGVRGAGIAPLTDGFSGSNASQNCQGQTFDAKAKLVCSKTFFMAGICGTRPNEIPPSPGWGGVAWATVPWEPRPITIVGASADLQGNGQFLGAFVGDSYTPDPVTPLRYALNNGTMVALHNAMIFPPGSGMAFPAASTEKRPDHTFHLDLHLYCGPDGSSYSGYVFVWYIPEPQQN